MNMKADLSVDLSSFPLIAVILTRGDHCQVGILLMIIKLLLSYYWLLSLFWYWQGATTGGRPFSDGHIVKQTAGWLQMMIVAMMKMILMILMVMKTELLVATQYNLELRGVRTRNTQRVLIKLQLKDSSGKQGFFFDIIDRQKCGDDDDSCLHVDDEFLRSARTKVWGKNDAKALQTAKMFW